MPDGPAAGEELIEGVNRQARGDENQREHDGLRSLDAVQVVHHDEEKRRIDRDPEQFLARDILDVRLPVTHHGQHDERGHAPRHRRPEQRAVALNPEAHRPERERDDGQRLHHDKLRRTHRAERQRCENQQGQHSREDSPFQSGIETLAIHPRNPAGRATGEARRKWGARLCRRPAAAARPAGRLKHFQECPALSECCGWCSAHSRAPGERAERGCVPRRAGSAAAAQSGGAREVISKLAHGGRVLRLVAATQPRSGEGRPGIIHLPNRRGG